VWSVCVGFISVTQFRNPYGDFIDCVRVSRGKSRWFLTHAQGPQSLASIITGLQGFTGFTGLASGSGGGA
jgi:hypothetical protein